MGFFGIGVVTVFWELKVADDGFLSNLLPCKDVEELNFFVDKDDNFDKEVKDLDLDVSEERMTT